MPAGRTPNGKAAPQKGAPRKSLPADVETEVLHASLRRCCLCFGLDGITTTKRGQIAHIDHNRANNQLSNLAWLCLPHHDQYDSRTSQSKNITAAELRRHQRKLFEWVRTVEPKPHPPPAHEEKPAAPKKPDAPAELIIDDWQTFRPAEFFANRLTDAFPGLRGFREITDPLDISARLAIVLRPPLTVRTEDNKNRVTPIWWWGRGNYHISSGTKLPKGRFLMDDHEFLPRRLVAVHAGPNHAFLYVETAAEKPSGAYAYQEGEIEAAVAKHGQASEEYALFRGYPIRLEEFEDDAAEIDGRPVKLNGQAIRRRRHLAPYNFLIASHNSPINNNGFDRQLHALLNAVLKDPENFEKLMAAIFGLPPRQRLS